VKNINAIIIEVGDNLRLNALLLVLNELTNLKIEFFRIH